MKLSKKDIEAIAQRVAEIAISKIYFAKPILTFDEGCMYTGLSKSYMYKHTSNGNIPFFKPEGRKIYFKREDLENWMLRNRQSSNDEINSMLAKQSKFLK